MRIGVSTSCLYPMPTEESLLRLVEIGIREVEVFFNAGCEARGEILQTLCDICKANDLHVQAVHPYMSFAESYMLFGIYPRRVQDAMEIYRGLCDACHALGSDKLVLHGQKEPYEISEAEYIERFGTLSLQTRLEGVQLTQENVVRFRASKPAFLRRMRADLGDLFAMTLDVKQAIRSGEDPLEMAREFAPVITHLHLSDHDDKDDCIVPGTGVFDFSALFRVLRDGGFAGDAVVELYSKRLKSVEALYAGVEKLAQISEI